MFGYIELFLCVCFLLAIREVIHKGKIRIAKLLKFVQKAIPVFDMAFSLLELSSHSPAYGSSHSQPRAGHTAYLRAQAPKVAPSFA